MKNIVSLFITLLIITSLQAQTEKHRVAIFDPTTAGIATDEGTKLAVQALISSTFVNTGRFIVVERSMIDKIMKEQAFQNSDLADDSQATKIGKLLGANKVVLSEVSLVGGRNMLSIKLIDVETAILDQHKTRIVGTNDLLDAVEPLTLELLGEKAVYPPSKPTGSQHNTPVTQSSTPIQANANYTIFHDLGLMVTRSMGSCSWLEAKGKCAELSLGGFNDWFLPSKNELVMIFQTGDKLFQSGLNSFWFWSSTEVDSKKAYNVATSGWSDDESKDTRKNKPDCVCARRFK